MLILISQLANQPVIAFDEAEQLGVLGDPIIDPNNGRVCGYFVTQGWFRPKQQVVSSDAIVNYDNSRVVIQAPSAIQAVEEEPKIRQILKKKVPVLGAHVITESGQNLGRANDLLFDSELSMIVKYYVHSLLQDRIIPAEAVIKIEKRGIIVNDTVPNAAAAAEAELT